MFSYFDYFLFIRVRQSKNTLNQYKKQGLTEVTSDDPLFYTYQDAHSYLYSYIPSEHSVPVFDFTNIVNEVYDQLYCRVNPFLIAKLLRKENKNIPYVDCLKQVKKAVSENVAKFTQNVDRFPYRVDTYGECIKSGNTSLMA